jgi:4-amino-4-deoxy-L-arabinose transferase-like glycosyltransferase
MSFPNETRHSRWLGVSVIAILATIAIFRIVSTYAITPQAFDEVCHVAAGIELLDRHTYTLDPVHPPLARIAIGLPLYLTGARYPQLPPLGHVITYTDVGNAILYGQDTGLEHYVRTLRLARLGVLPFFLLGVALVFLWARREYGELAGVMAAAFFTTTPSILAFSSIAYTDVVAASTQVAAIFSFVQWLDKPTRRSALWLGLAAGLALASKATTVMFLAAAAVAIVLVKWATTRKVVSAMPRVVTRQLALALALACATVWATYGFAVGHVREGMNLSVAQIPSFQHFPAPLAKIGRQLILSDPLMPAPALVRGLAQAWVLNKLRPDVYLFGHIRAGGWWYFFLVCIAVKTPIPILILSAVGVFAAWTAEPGSAEPGTRWKALAPAVAAAAILLVTMPVKYQAGSRHVLVVLPLLCIMAGCGAARLRSHTVARGYAPETKPGQSPHRTRIAMRTALIALLAWQGISTLRAGGDFLSYFNEFAGNDPGKVLQGGCDLDCGQDLFRLATEFKALHVSHAAIAVWTSSVPERMGLPPFVVPQPYHPAVGWIAVSERAMCCGTVFHEAYPPDAFDWLKPYQPVAYAGKTIRLYYIPAKY